MIVTQDTPGKRLRLEGAPAAPGCLLLPLAPVLRRVVAFDADRDSGTLLIETTTGFGLLSGRLEIPQRSIPKLVLETSILSHLGENTAKHCTFSLTLFEQGKAGLRERPFRLRVDEPLTRSGMEQLMKKIGAAAGMACYQGGMMPWPIRLTYYRDKIDGAHPLAGALGDAPPESPSPRGS